MLAAALRARDVVPLGLALVLAAAAPKASAEPEGRTVHLVANGYSFRVLEPAGWKLDLRSAPQLAAFILYPAERNWRRSETVIYANFLPAEKKTLAEFLEADRDRFREDCGCPDDGEPARPRALGLFQVQQYRCPTGRDEMMAAAQMGEFHFVLLLSSESDEGFKAALPVFEKVVDRFSWSRRD